MILKEQLLKELREDRSFVYDLQRELEIDDLEFKIDELEKSKVINN